MTVSSSAVRNQKLKTRPESPIIHSEEMVLWIFGYGSLIWTPDFRYEERVPGYIKDFKRIFAPATLGLTLQPQEGAITGGVAYRVTDDVENQILTSYLDERLTSPSRCRVMMVEFFTGEEGSDTATIRAMTYITPPERSNLWHIVLQLSPVVTTVHRSDRESSDSDRAMVVISKTKGRWLSAHRASVKDHWTRDRAWFESQQNSNQLNY